MNAVNSIKQTSKRLQIDKSSAKMVMVVGIASFVTIFCLIACRALLVQRSYQARIIKSKSQARDQLRSNLVAVDTLKTQYEAFAEQSTNVLRGSANGKGETDGDNARIILDALPSQYDFPALTSSLEKMVGDEKFKLSSLTGTDDQINQEANAGSSTPVPVEVPFEITISNNYKAAKRLISTLDHWIRPVQIKTISMNGADNQMTITVTANTFYQPSKSLNITTKEVK